MCMCDSPTCSDAGEHEQCIPYPCCPAKDGLQCAYVSGWVEDTVEGGGVDGREVH